MGAIGLLSGGGGGGDKAKPGLTRVALEPRFTVKTRLQWQRRGWHCLMISVWSRHVAIDQGMSRSSSNVTDILVSDCGANDGFRVFLSSPIPLWRYP